MRVYFNDDDDLVFDDIPEQMMREIERRAAVAGRTPEDEVRAILVKEFSEPSA